MEMAFYISAVVAVLSTLLVITGSNPVHALLNLIVSLLAVAMIFFSIGAPFAGALEVIVYAGAILVLFVFVVMMLNLGPETTNQEKKWMRFESWVLPAFLALVLLVELFRVIPAGQAGFGVTTIDARQVGIALFGPYLLAVELASMILLGALVAAYHLSRSDDKKEVH